MIQFEVFGSTKESDMVKNLIELNMLVTYWEHAAIAVLILVKNRAEKPVAGTVKRSDTKALLGHCKYYNVLESPLQNIQSEFLSYILA